MCTRYFFDLRYWWGDCNIYNVMWQMSNPNRRTTDMIKSNVHNIFNTNCTMMIINRTLPYANMSLSLWWCRTMHDNTTTNVEWHKNDICKRWYFFVKGECSVLLFKSYCLIARITKMFKLYKINPIVTAGPDTPPRHQYHPQICPSSQQPHHNEHCPER